MRLMGAFRTETRMTADVPNIIRPGGNQPHVVIAFSYADNEFARKLTFSLRREGVTTLIDELDMSAGVILVNRITHSARPVDFVVPLISRSSIGTRWVQNDLRAILVRETSQRSARMLPARIDSTSLPEHLRAQTYIDFHANGWQKAIDDLKLIIRPGAIPSSAVRRAAELASEAPVRQREPQPVRRSQPAAEKKPEGKVVFVSYDYDNDGYYKDVLQTWAKMPEFPRFIFNDQPVSVPVDSEEAEPLKRAVYGQIKAATGYLCVVGEKTIASDWVNWEIKTAIELEKRMIVARINRESAAPDVLSEVGPTSALSFTFEGIKRAIDEAYGVISEE